MSKYLYRSLIFIFQAYPHLSSKEISIFKKNVYMILTEKTRRALQRVVDTWSSVGHADAEWANAYHAFEEQLFFLLLKQESAVLALRQA